jgi:hypothetical protein
MTNRDNEPVQPRMEVLFDWMGFLIPFQPWTFGEHGDFDITTEQERVLKGTG